MYIISLNSAVVYCCYFNLIKFSCGLLLLF